MKDSNSNIKLGSDFDFNVGETYPVCGKITAILDEGPGKVAVLLNDSITAYMTLHTAEKVETIKSRAFDTGIFIATVLDSNQGKIVVDCHKVIFGKASGFDA